MRQPTFMAVWNLVIQQASSESRMREIRLSGSMGR
jgi:hypothetical protein